ncbi:P-loop containing nucleoside triphosphate hydrolase protein [Roridomyces roridus]|uniref:P-loop containing nucleoside triphosphate hydrolase protein n=1 Tax=Roridomyces roridus TaxID=1738132 RepID=A0AAD7BA08_9AGAR|nr:P-loop containing nucleoside triphosphate hydrolase protein [Roridomyces roridus]
MSVPTVDTQTGTHFHVHGGTGGPGGGADQQGGEGGPGEGGALFYQSRINNLNVYSHTQEPRQQGQIELITQEQCHTALALVRCPPASQIFQGRKEILDKMQQYFPQEPKKRRIFVLYGLGGSGKTQIALKFLEETSDDVSRQFFMNASSSEALNNSLMNIAISQRFGQTPEAGLQWLISEYKEWTLLFDNADDPKLKLLPFLPQCTHGKIIITSRNPQLAAYGPASHSPVGDLDDENAALLLLARAVKEHTDETYKLAVSGSSGNDFMLNEDVQELSCLPLAIVQAGAYIAKFKCLKNYLSIYTQNKKELLLQHPDQTLDDYEWTVYTTWQISFEKLSPIAAQFLQLCSLLHHSNIPQSIFANATQWILNNEGSETGSMGEAREFLQNFVSGSGNWSEQYFRNIVAEVEEYSLLQSDETSSTLSMHPLVHLWCSGNLPDEVTTQACMANVLGMATDLGPDAYLDRIRIIAHVNRLVPDFTVLDSQFWEPYACIYYDGGNFEQAKGLCEMDLERQRELFGNDHPDTLFAMANLAATYWQLGQYQEAEGLGISVLQGRQKLLGNDHPDTLTAMANLASTYGRLGWYQEAEGLEISVLQGRQKLLGNDHPDTLFAMANLAATYWQLGQYQEAEGLEISVLQGRQKLLGNDHPETLTAMANLAGTYGRLGRYQEAEELEISVLQGRQKLLGNDHLDTLFAMANLASMYRRLGRYQEAEGLEISVLQGRQKLLGNDHPDTLFAMANLAATYWQLGQYQEAEGLEISVLQGRQKLLGNDHPDTLFAMANLAMTLSSTGRHQAAENLQLKVVAKRRQVLGGPSRYSVRYQRLNSYKRCFDQGQRYRIQTHQCQEALQTVFQIQISRAHLQKVGA